MKTNEDNVQNEIALIDCLHVGDKRLAQYLYTTYYTKEGVKVSDVVISTGAIQGNYEVLDTIFALGSGEAGVFTRAPDNAFKGLKTELVSKCKALGGNAVIFCQFEYRITLNDGLFGKKQGIEIFAYGTAVRMA